MEGNLLTEEEQWAKLQLVVDVARSLGLRIYAGHLDRQSRPSLETVNIGIILNSSAI